MASVNMSLALELTRQRLNRLDHLLDEYLTHRIQAAADDLTGRGIHLGDKEGDLMLLIDYAVWQYGSRDQTGELPPWLRKRINNRWLEERSDSV